jgi:hypothetical protein
MEEVAKKYPNVKNGAWKPPESECIARRRIAIVIPHRHFPQKLIIFINIYFIKESFCPFKGIAEYFALISPKTTSGLSNICGGSSLSKGWNN